MIYFLMAKESKQGLRNKNLIRLPLNACLSTYYASYKLPLRTMKKIVIASLAVCALFAASCIRATIVPLQIPGNLGSSTTRRNMYGAVLTMPQFLQVLLTAVQLLLLIRPGSNSISENYQLRPVYII